MRRDARYYRQLARLMIQRVEKMFGTKWQSVFSVELQREICAAAAFHIMRNASGTQGMDADQLVQHTTTAHRTMLTMCGIPWTWGPER